MGSGATTLLPRPGSNLNGDNDGGVDRRSMTLESIDFVDLDQKLVTR